MMYARKKFFYTNEERMEYLNLEFCSAEQERREEATHTLWMWLQQGVFSYREFKQILDRINDRTHAL